MRDFNIGDTVFWFCVDSTSGNVYPNWLNICSGKVVWKSPYEEIMHVYVDGESSIHVLLDDSRHVFSSKETAFECMYSRLKGIENV